ncbi:hypothetical protein B296_00013643 [Ensete ventricosum]|uniref:Transposase (putative) gypsy type domain-containing protein n=1 Tax=Ensete ventricosum TaxID=4639 RepID=A0A427ADB7_ENSVE|nr:hypothetical protein B296_00013643 [Ensete ventricosum]
MLRRGAGAFIVSVTDHSYLRSSMPLWLTILSYFSTPSVVLAVRCTFCLLQLWLVDLILAKSTVQPLAPPYLCQVGHAGDLELDKGVGMWQLGEPEASSLGASSGSPSPIDARVLRDLDVIKAGHDLDTTVTEGSLAAIKERYNIPAKYGLHVLRSGQRPYSSDASGVCISVDALEAGLRFLLHPIIEEYIRWWRISLSQVAPNSWRYLVVFLGECRGAEIIPTRDLFMACFRLCKSRGGYYLTACVSFRVSGAPSNNKGWMSRYLFVSGPNWGFRLDWPAHPIGNVPLYLSEEESVLVGRLKGILSSYCAIKEMTELWLVEAGLSLASRDQMDLGDLRGMPKVSGGKTPSVRAVVPAREVGVSPAGEAPKTSSKRLTDTPNEQTDDPDHRHKKVKILSRRHKSCHGEGGSQSHFKGKEPAASVEVPETLVESAEEDASPVHHHPRSMKDLFKTKVQKDDAGYYALYLSDLAHQDPDKEMQARWGKLKNSTKVWNDPSVAEEFERGLLHP